MGEISFVENIINELLDRKEVYKVGKKVTVIEPMDEYWRECVCLFLSAVVHYLKENHTSEDELCYYAVLDFIQRARSMDIDELTAFFGNSNGNESSTSEAYKCYSAFLDKSGKTVVTVMLAAYTEIKGIYFDKQRIAELERVFEI